MKFKIILVYRFSWASGKEAKVTYAAIMGGWSAAQDYMQHLSNKDGWVLTDVGVMGQADLLDQEAIRELRKSSRDRDESRQVDKTDAPGELYECNSCKELGEKIGGYVLEKKWHPMKIGCDCPNARFNKVENASIRAINFEEPAS